MKIDLLGTKEVGDLIKSISNRNPLKFKHNKLTYMQQMGYLFEDLLWAAMQEIGTDLERGKKFDVSGRRHTHTVDYYDRKRRIIYDAKLNSNGAYSFDTKDSIMEIAPTLYVVIYIKPNGFRRNREGLLYVNADYYFSKVKHRQDLTTLYDFIKGEVG